MPFKPYTIIQKNITLRLHIW